MICTYNFLHFLLGFTHCSLSSNVKVEDTQLSALHYFLYCYSSLWCLQSDLADTFFGWISYCALSLCIKISSHFLFHCWDHVGTLGNMFLPLVSKMIFAKIFQQNMLPVSMEERVFPLRTLAQEITTINSQPFDRSGYLKKKKLYKAGIMIPTDQQREQDTTHKCDCWSKPANHWLKVSSYPKGQMTKIPTLKGNAQFTLYQSHLRPHSFLSLSQVSRNACRRQYFLGGIFQSRNNPSGITGSWNICNQDPVRLNERRKHSLHGYEANPPTFSHLN